MSSLHRPVTPERIAITSGGVNALMVAMQTLIDPGDHVVAVVPLWPNLTAQASIMGAEVQRVSLRVDPARPEAGWTLDLDALLQAITPRTRVLFGRMRRTTRPGWTLTSAEQARILAHCRRTGTWVVADEVYERVYFGPGRAEAGGRVAAPAFWTWPSPTTAWWWCTAFPRVF